MQLDTTMPAGLGKRNLALIEELDYALNFLKSIPLVGSGAGLQTLLQRDVPDESR